MATLRPPQILCGRCMYFSILGAYSRRILAVEQMSPKHNTAHIPKEPERVLGWKQKNVHRTRYEHHENDVGLLGINNWGGGIGVSISQFTVAV